jgi:Putative amidase domain/Fibronectin type III domain
MSTSKKLRPAVFSVILVMGAGLASVTPANASGGAPPVPSYVQTAATYTVTPVLSGVLQDSADAPLTGEFFLFTSAGVAIGGSPTATGTVSSGERITYMVPNAVLSNRDSYEWYMEACYQGTCSSPTSMQYFTIDTGDAPGPLSGTTTATISGSSVTNFDGITDSGACSGSDCPVTTNTTLNVGGDGTNHWASALEFNLSAIPTNAVVTNASLDLTESGCLGTGCSPPWTGTLDIYQAESPVTSASTGPELAAAAGSGSTPIAAIPGNAGGSNFTDMVDSWVGGVAANNGLVLEAAGNPTATSGASYYSTSASAPSADLPQLVVTYLPAATPGTPTGLSVTAGSGGVEATWDAPVNQGDDQGVTGYKVQAMTSTGGVAATTTADGTSTVLTGLTNGQPYTIHVAAINAEGTGSAEVSGSVTPAAVTGSTADGQAVQQFLTAQTGLQDGQYSTATAAVSGDSESSMISTQLTAEQSTDTTFASDMVAQDIAESSAADTLTNTLTVPIAGGGTQVYTTDALSYNTVTAVGTGNQQSTPSEQLMDYLFTISSGGSPQITGYVDADAVTYQVTDSDNTSATSTSLNDNPGTTFPPGYTPPSPAAVTGGTNETASTSVNLVGVANAALANWNGSYDGYGDDCTDFVSRALRWGGSDPENEGWDAPINHEDDHYWYRSSWAGVTIGSYSWAGAYHLADHLNLNGSYYRAYTSFSTPGDIIFADWYGDSFTGISHSGVITAMSNGIPLITQHSPRGWNVPLPVWLDSHPHVYVWVAIPNPG